MSEQQYDNSNRGALWTTKGCAGKANLLNEEWRSYVVATGARADNAPVAMLFLVHPDYQTHNTALFREQNERFPNNVMGGKLTIPGQGTWYVNVYKKGADAADRAPDLTVRFKAASNDATPEPAPEPEPVHPDDIPF